MTLARSLVQETSTSTGTGNLILAVKNGYRDFATAFGTGVTTNVFYYFISDSTNNAWEVGTGHMSDAVTLVRDTIIESSNSNATVNFLGGTLNVVNDIRAANQVDLSQNNTFAGVQTFTNSPVIPTATAGDNSTNAASTAYAQKMDLAYLSYASLGVL